MRKHVISLLLLLCTAPGLRSQTGPDSFNSLKKGFASPGKQYGSAPLWVWNAKVTKKEIDLMLADFAGKAFGGVMVHPRPGLITPYLSPEWMELFWYTVEKGKSLGLDVWIYDENSYPTGFAGGHVPDQMPESYNQGQMLHLVKADAPPAGNKDVFICLQEENGAFKDVTGQPANGKGKYYSFSKAYYGKGGWYGGFSYVDLLVKGVTEKFIEVTFKKYEPFIGKDFGKTIPGIFSDEPGIQAEGRDNIRWTPDLFSAFQQRWGYDLRLHLPSLFEETGNWKKVRHNYYQVLLQLFIDRWFKPMHQYTEKHNLKWTGHYWEHGWPNPEHGADNMAAYAWHQQPGIDMLFNQFDETSPNAQFGNIRSVKELASVANQLNKKRRLSETYGGGGWELTFKDMKRLGDWEYALGVNFLNQHLSFMTLAGARKGDYPPSFSYHNPWWPHYGTLNAYFGRLSFALSQGEQENAILVMEPTTSAWMYAVRGRALPRFTAIGREFQAYITRLEKSQVEYDLGSEQVIKDHGRIRNGCFVIRQRAYSTVVLPPGMENVNAYTLQLLKEYKAKGGKLVVLDTLQTVDGAAAVDVQQFPKTAGDTTLTHPDGFLVEKDGDAGNLFHQRRRLKDGQLLFLTNADMHTAASGKVTMPGKDALLLNPFTGKISDYPEQAQSAGIQLSYHLPPAGSLLLFIADRPETGWPAYPVPGKGTAIEASPVSVQRPAENTLMIDFCDVQFADTLLTDHHVTYAADILFKHYGFPSGNPWNHEVQFKDRLIARDTFPKGTGFTATYKFVIDPGVAFSKFRAVVERAGIWNNIRVNGKTVQPVPGQWWLDRSFAVLEIGRYLHAGENTLSVSVSPMKIHAEIEPVYLLGDFNLAAAGKGWRVTAPAPLTTGSWKTQGLPLYGQHITYVKTFQLTDAGKRTVVTLGNWKGTVADVKVNGAPAGIIFAEPDALDITALVKKGHNRIEVNVTGSLKNLLGPHHNNPKPGLVSPWHWRNIKKYPSGSDYQLYDYGLMEDVKIEQY